MPALPVLPAADDAALREACAALDAGRLVVVPTETVYGLAADARNAEAVARIYAAKGRPSHNPLIVHVADLDAAEQVAVFDERARRLAATFWPGPLTLVLPLRPDAGLAPAVTAGLQTVAVRVPDQPDLLGLLRRFVGPLAAPSANRSGRLSPTRAADAAADLDHPEALPHVACVLDGGPCARGLESTIVGLTDATPRLLRPGALEPARIEALVGPLAAPDAAAGVVAPGMLLRHYAPGLPLRLDVEVPLPFEAYLAFGPEAVEGAFCNLSPNGDVAEAARRLFAALRDADDPTRFRGIAVAPLPPAGVGLALHDRLRRAAASSRDPDAVRVVVFDLGGVVVQIARTWAERCAAAGLPVRDGADGDAALAACAAEIDAVQRGTATTRAVAEALHAALRGAYTVDELERLYESQVTGPYPGVAALTTRLRCPHAILSNTSAGHWPGLCATEVVRSAVARFASFELGLLKPERAIFDHVAGALGEAPGHLLLIEDSAPNAAAAAAAGWQVECVDPFGDVAAQLEERFAARGLLRG
ncbi:MAG: threonylcarbamoyl-AMP synthase [Deltaproteobacteria bacterium]|nr:threonylcarbamoyl-AMP synthase [Deltaproteobacteria bacterium]